MQEKIKIDRKGEDFAFNILYQPNHFTCRLKPFNSIKYNIGIKYLLRLINLIIFLNLRNGIILKMGLP